ncbi:MAG TPA: DUF1294 domain-containing protein [Burkholderiaceae bacterium]|jgi:uncharacterized membrane protein YsdA (DUF1294 family)
MYAIASTIAFVTYAIDKRAAATGRRRIPEARLHWLSLLGGWPGAWLAQSMLCHKTQKQGFRAVFFVTVAINCLSLSGLIVLFMKGTFP